MAHDTQTETWDKRKEGVGAAKRRPKKGPKKAEPKGKKPKSSSTQPWKPLSIRQAVKDVVAEGGSPKLTTDEARMDRIDKKLSVIPAKKYKKGGRAGYQSGGRTNLFEELGRVEGEPSNRNRRAEVSRIHGELNKGYSLGGRVGAAKRGFNKKILRKD